jgi:acyl-CoA synthetase (AMP-forming)/AMP-acid ligase II
MFLLPLGARTHPALRDPAQSGWLTYGDLAAAVAGRLARLETPTKSLVFLFCRNDARSIVWYLAAMDAGHAVALLNDTLAADLKQGLIDAYNPDFVFNPPAGTGYAEIDGGMCKRTDSSEGEIHPDLCVLLSTSGSTGSPKFVRLSQRNVLANAESIAAALDIQPEDRAVTSLPMSYSYGLSVVNTHLLRGATLALTNEALTSRTLWETIRNEACSSFAGVPYTYQMLERLKLDALDVPSLRVLTQAGGKLPSNLAQKYHQIMEARGGRFHVMYGQTEATARIAIMPHEDLPARPSSAGRVIPGGRLLIHDNGELTTEPNRTGELVYEGPNVMLGYATSRADLALGDTLGGRLYTGDTAHLDALGFLYVLGRSGREAKVYGLRINLDEIEGLMKAHGPTAVVSKDDTLHLFCEYGDADSYAQHQRHLSEKLRLNHRAFVFHRSDSLPLQASGKIDYRKLIERI